MKLVYPEGATPLDRNEAEGLIAPVTLQSELNAWEAANIERARLWARRSRALKRALLTIDGITLLHRKMFEDVWEWAGKFRSTEKNLGRPWHVIPMELSVLCADVSYQIEYQSLPWVSIAVQFHHRLVSIHPFPNGNGRHARLSADILLAFHGQKPLTWGQSIVDLGERRRTYLEALREADRSDYRKLLEFAVG